MLTLPLERARRLLRYLAARGWLSRVSRGIYTTVPLGASDPSAWREDPWVVATRVFSPCYLGGWSACEHWGFTEQVFRDIVVVTARAVRANHTERQGTSFRLKSLRKSKHFGTRAVWKGPVKVQVSDPTRTVVDILDDPPMGGGIRHAADVVGAYLESEHRDDIRLLDYTKRLGNRTVYKRLGFILEARDTPAPMLVAVCREHLSSGLSVLDPSVRRRGRIVKRWNLRVNVELSGRGAGA